MWLTPYTSRRVVPSFHSLFDEVFKGFDAVESPKSRFYSPSVEVKEDEKGYHISVEVPGIEKGDVDISLKNNVLTIKGDKKQETTKEKDGYSWTERAYGSFHRSLRVPEGTQEDQVDAHLENGVLAITVPKADEPERKQITIN